MRYVRFGGALFGGIYSSPAESNDVPLFMSSWTKSSGATHFIKHAEALERCQPWLPDEHRPAHVMQGHAWDEKDESNWLVRNRESQFISNAQAESWVTVHPAMGNSNLVTDRRLFRVLAPHVKKINTSRGNALSKLALSHVYSIRVSVSNKLLLTWTPYYYPSSLTRTGIHSGYV